MTLSYSGEGGGHADLGFLYFACIHTRYIFNIRPLFTCNRLSVRLSSSTNPDWTNKDLIFSEK